MNEAILIKGVIKSRKIIWKIIYGVLIAMFVFALLASAINNEDIHILFQIGVLYILINVLCIIAIFIFFIFLCKCEKCEITVTDKRICGRTRKGDLVNIELSSVTSVTLSSFEGISILTDDEKVIAFSFLKNRYEVMKALKHILKG